MFQVVLVLVVASVAGAIAAFAAKRASVGPSHGVAVPTVAAVFLAGYLLFGVGVLLAFQAVPTVDVASQEQLLRDGVSVALQPLVVGVIGAFVVAGINGWGLSKVKAAGHAVISARSVAFGVVGALPVLGVIGFAVSSWASFEQMNAATNLDAAAQAALAQSVAGSLMASVSLSFFGLLLCSALALIAFGFGGKPCTGELDAVEAPA